MASPSLPPLLPEHGPAAGAVASPCIRHCTLNDDDVCVGCGRTLNDIVNWTKMSEEEKALTVVRARERLVGLGRLRP